MWFFVCGCLILYLSVCRFLYAFLDPRYGYICVCRYIFKSVSLSQRLHVCRCAGICPWVCVCVCLRFYSCLRVVLSVSESVRLCMYLSVCLCT